MNVDIHIQNTNEKNILNKHCNIYGKIKDEYMLSVPINFHTAELLKKLQ